MPLSDSKRQEKASDAPEVDQSAHVPQHYPLAEGLHLQYEDNGLEPAIDRTHPYAIELPPTQTSPVSAKLKLILVSAIISVALLCTALGAGLGVGLRNNEASSISTSTATTALTPTTTDAPSPPLKRGILNDTSLATVTTFEGNRHVFFQDLNGSLRHTVFYQGANSWANEADYVNLASSARNHTPIAAIKLGAEILGFDRILIFYVSIENVLASTLYGVHAANILNGNLMNNSFPVVTGSRTLSVTQMALSQNETTEAVLLYEAPGADFTALHGYLSASESNPQWLWQNVSEAVYSQLDKSNVRLSPPFASGPSSSEPAQVVKILIFNSNALSDATTSPLYFIYLGLPSPSNATIVPFTSASNSPTIAVEESDVMLFSVQSHNLDLGGLVAWVQNQSLVFNIFHESGRPNPSPDTPYPFSRLAWLNNINASATYVYHQLSESILTEDTFFVDGGEWHTTNITIDTST